MPFGKASFHFSLIGVLSLFLVAFNVIWATHPKEAQRLIDGPSIVFDTETSIRARESGIKLANRIVEEGTVLLKNEDNALPLSDRDVNLFGYGSTGKGFVHRGGGSSRTSDYGMVSFFDALSQNGFHPNQRLSDAFDAIPYSRQATSTTISNQFRCIEAHFDDFDEDVLEDAINYSDTAIYVVSRTATEKLDLPIIQYDEFGVERYQEHYLSFSEREMEWVNYLKEKYSTFVLILNCPAPMELPFYQDPQIDAIIQLGYPGNSGLAGLGGILSGEVNPSGRTVDTFATDIATNPSTCNSSTLGSHTYRDDARFIEYEEGIYVGYRYYETADEELNWGEAYSTIIAYPFGHGLSYTSFSWELEEVSFVDENGGKSSLSSLSSVGGDGTFSISVWVENIGSVSGADVVEIYAKTPYFKENNIEKASVVLAGFGKTAVLEPGKGESVEIEIPLRSLASYDCYDGNCNGFVGYELEAGDYSLSLRKNAHEVHEMVGGGSDVLFSLSQNVFYGNDDKTGEPIHNLFTNFSNPKSGATSSIVERQSPLTFSIDASDTDYPIEYLSRKDFVSTFPQETQDKEISDDMFDRNFHIHAPIIDPLDEHPQFAAETEYTIVDGFGKDYDDPIFLALARQCTKLELREFVAHAGFGTAELPSIKKPECIDLDGPVGINTTIMDNSPGEATNYPSTCVLAQSFSRDLAYEFGQAIAKEANSLGINGWYAPATNIHRSPLSGRNFEYFSEDPLLSGEMSAYVCLGSIEGGVYCYLKHFAVDENETGTNSQYHWLTEQALREIYAKPFEIAVKKADVNAVMTSKNRIGSVRSCGSSALLEDLLRKEWGFKGSVICDYYISGSTNDADEQIRAGCDLCLDGTGEVYFDDSISATFEIALQKAVSHALYTYCSTMHRANAAQNLSFDHLTGSKRKQTNNWIYILVGIDVGMVVLLAGYGIIVYKKLVKKKG